MNFFQKVIDCFDEHPGYEILMAFTALVLSTIPYIWRFFARRFRLKVSPMAYKYFIFDESQNTNLAIQMAITNLSETPCTITQMFLVINGEEKYVSFASENLFQIRVLQEKTGDYFSLSLPQHLPPHQGISGCFVIPNCKTTITELKKSKCAIKIVCGKKKRIMRIDFSSLHTPLYL